jgi:hypothetical protein
VANIDEFPGVEIKTAVAIMFQCLNNELFIPVVGEIFKTQPEQWYAKAGANGSGYSFDACQGGSRAW